MPPSRPGRPVRAARTTAAVALLLATAVACGDTGALRGAGATPTATSPAKLWPNLSPAASPAYDFDEADTETVKGVTVPGDDIRKVDPIAVVRAEIAARPSDYDGSQAPYRGTAEKSPTARTRVRTVAPVPFSSPTTGTSPATGATTSRSGSGCCRPR